ncbi:glycosyltransferase family 4 protein [Chenggangzhangella methanolivorans]|uniref:Glycosyltransferase family 4 protein n=1 Tax=Chenggangzhangella methanolivorans TaxID=1437009 RepID=A0A9E6R7N9_9HYPH|nr:glycosyltransferase family 4 protein [Chenggangzhangella methanolivorans]QZN99725.1 glycosyltransferase family 4 protein [Chenggangzhangella methanolivorans]
MSDKLDRTIKGDEVQDGSYTFRMEIPQAFRDGQTHTFSARAEAGEFALKQRVETFVIEEGVGAPQIHVASIHEKTLIGRTSVFDDKNVTLEIWNEQGRVADFYCTQPGGEADGAFRITLDDEVFEIVERGGCSLVAIGMPEGGYPGFEILPEMLTSAFPLVEPTETNPQWSASAATIYDIVFVLNINSKGWILEKICRVIAENTGLSYRIVFTERNSSFTNWLPNAPRYFFGHYKLYLMARDQDPEFFADKQCFVWFTHPVFDSVKRDGFVAKMNMATKIVTANLFHRRALEFMGVESERIATVLGGADPDVFTTAPRTGRTVGVVGAYYERKNPALLLELVRAMPGTNFLLIGPAREDIENQNLIWEAWPRFDELLSLPNFDYVTPPYHAYGEYYHKFDVYLSLSSLEGGPIPLIEAMFCNRMPVITRTGFAEDIVEHRRNGYLIDIEPSLVDVVKAVEWAQDHTTEDVSTTVRNYSWKQFGLEFRRLLSSSVPNGETVDFGGETKGVVVREGWRVVPDSGLVLESRRGGVTIYAEAPFSQIDIAFDINPSFAASIEGLRIFANDEISEVQISSAARKSATISFGSTDEGLNEINLDIEAIAQDWRPNCVLFRSVTVS